MEVYNLDTRLTMYNNFKKNGKGAEIGVCKGANAVSLFVAARPVELHLVDLWERDELTEKNHPIELHYGDWRQNIDFLFHNEISNKSVILHKMKSIDFLNTLPDNYLDWIYIDGDHEFSTVIEELRLSAKKVKKGGVICGHDFLVMQGAWRSGIVRAVITCVQEGLMTMEAITEEVFPSYFCRVN